MCVNKNYTKGTSLKLVDRFTYQGSSARINLNAILHVNNKDHQPIQIFIHLNSANFRHNNTNSPEE